MSIVLYWINENEKGCPSIAAFLWGNCARGWGSVERHFRLTLGGEKAIRRNV